jgi:hypothetical protein
VFLLFIAVLYFHPVDDKTNNTDLIKLFTNTIIWLAGIYVGGTVAALAVEKPQQVTVTHDPGVRNP